MRIEGYDVAHISGTAMVGVMTVIVDGEPEKNEYRKFKIKTVRGADDTASLTEVLERRFGHPEWPYPRLIVVDGGVAQKNRAERVLSEIGINIPVVSVVKRRTSSSSRDSPGWKRSDIRELEGPTLSARFFAQMRRRIDLPFCITRKLGRPHFLVRADKKCVTIT